MEFEGATGFNHAIHYGKTLVCQMINSRFTLAYTDGQSFYDYATNRMLSAGIIREVMVLEKKESHEPFTGNVRHVTQTVERVKQAKELLDTEFKAEDFLPADEQTTDDGPGMFDFSANDHAKRKSSSSNNHKGETYGDKLPF